MGYIWKPSTRKGPVFLAPEPGDPPTIKLSDGTVVTAVRGDQKGGVFHGDNGYQWVFPDSVLGQEGAVLTYNGKEQKLEHSNSSYRGDSLGSLQPSTKGAIGTGQDTSGPTGGFGTSAVGDFGVAPNFIGDLFPKPVLIPDVSQTYNFIDPIHFGEQYNPFVRGETAANFGQAHDFALGAINTELEGLQAYVPKSAQLKRDTIAADNTFNQGQRTAQLNATIPGVVSNLKQQTADAAAYARGEVPNAVVDKALELGTRSASADIAATSGFGVSSSAARKLSDLMSAKERIGLSQYGESLIGQNAQQREQLEVAPTEYSNAGNQISVTPSISGSQLQVGQASELNANTVISGTNAFGQTIQQSQYVTSLQNNVNQFNATNQNNFALSYFNYLNSYVNSLAGAGQTSLNTGLSLQQQQQAQDLAVHEQHQTQANNAINSGIATAGTVIGAVAGLFSDKNLKKDIVEYTQGLKDILKLNPVRFVYRDESKPHISVIAQELQEVFPELVSEHPSGYLQIAPIELIFVLISAVKELAGRLLVVEEAHGIS